MKKWLKNKLRKWRLEDEDKADGTVDEDISNIETSMLDEDDEEGYSPEQLEIARLFLGNMSFTILTDGRVFINAGWIDDNDLVAEVFGKFLHALNDGQLAENMLGYLVQFGSQNIMAAKFTTKIMESWKKTQNESKNSPVICPTQTFKLNYGETQEE